MPFIVQVIALGIFFVWLGVVTYILFQIRSHYNKLADGTSSRSLKVILEEILSDVQLTKKDIVNLKNRCDTIEKDGVLHLQKIGLLRFNPFNDTGGDQSFILALLDGNNTGVIISSLYARSGARWYAKRITNGKAVEHTLSEDEKKAIKEAKTL